MWNPEKEPKTIWKEASQGGLSGRSETLAELEGQASYLEPEFSPCGSWCRSTRIAWETVRKEISCDSSQTY